MPEHASFFSYFVAMFPALDQNVEGMKTVIEGRPMTAHSFDPLFAAVFVALIVLGIAFKVNAELKKKNEAIRGLGCTLVEPCALRGRW